MAHRWIPQLIFSRVNRRVAWRLLAPILIVTGISGLGAGKLALPNLWQEILPALRNNVGQDSAVRMEPYFAASFVFSILAILFLVMILSRAVDIQLLFHAAGASFALSLLWLVCAVMSLLPPSWMGLHRVFIVLVVVVTVVAQFMTGGTLKYYWEKKYYGDLGVQVLFLATYLVFAWIPLEFALKGSH